jgi:hypothetical protein
VLSRLWATSGVAGGRLLKPDTEEMGVRFKDRGDEGPHDSRTRGGRLERPVPRNEVSATIAQFFLILLDLFFLALYSLLVKKCYQLGGPGSVLVL